MSSEYTVGAVADIIAKMSKSKRGKGLVETEIESVPIKIKQDKKRKLNGQNSKEIDDIIDEHIDKKASKKVKLSQKLEDGTTSKPQKMSKMKKAKLNKKSTTSNIVESLEKETSNEVDEEKTDQTVTKKTNKKQLKKKIKAKLDKSKKQNSETGSNIPKVIKQAKSKKSKQEPPSVISDGEIPRESNENSTQDKEKDGQEEGKGFPKHLGGDSEPEKEESKLNEEQESRTVFVGNLPLKITRDKVTNMFKQYGEVETVRFRSVPVGDISLPRNACIKMNRIHEKRTNMNAYVRFKDIESVEKALVMNGHIINEHTIRVDSALKKTKSNAHAIFIGNLPFEAEEEELRKVFEDCGDIENVRIIRDQKTNIGKGFGYVNFKSADGVVFAMELENVKIRNREIRVKRSFDKKTSNPSGRFNSSQFKPKSMNGGARFNKSLPERGGGFKGNKSHGAERRISNGGGRDFGGRKPQGGFNRRNDSAGFKERNNRGFNKKNDSVGFKSRDNGGRFNKKESTGGFKKNFGGNKNSFRGSTVEEKGNKNNQKKKLSYDALKKFIIAKKLTGGGEKKKAFSFLASG